MTPLTTLIAELEEALKAATAGPWAVDDCHSGNVISIAPSEHHPALGSYSNVCIGNTRDARLIALMRNSLPTLIEAVNDMQDRLEQIQGIAGADGDMTAALVSIGVIASNTGRQISEGFGLTALKETTDV